jgi:putative ABC transport system substrate-binding protein
MNRLRYPVLITLLAAGIISTPLAVEAQQAGKVWRIGVLGVVEAPAIQEAFRQGLRDRGYVEGKNVVFEWRFSEGKSERYADFVAEFLRLKVDLIVTAANFATQAAKSATTTVPIVMGSGSNPERVGLVASLSHPGGNITGLTIDTGPEIGGKMLQLLKEAAPRTTRVAIIVPGSLALTNTWLEPSGRLATEILKAARSLGVTVDPIVVSSPDELLKGLEAIGAGRHDAMLVGPGGLSFARRREIAESAAKYRLPDMHYFREATEAGGLMAYATDRQAVTSTGSSRAPSQATSPSSSRRSSSW